MAQLSFLSIALNKKKLRCEKFLDEMLKVVPWQMLLPLLGLLLLLKNKTKNKQPIFAENIYRLKSGIKI